MFLVALQVESGQRFHCTLGHFTTIVTLHCFSCLRLHQGPAQLPSGLGSIAFDSSWVYEERKCLSQDAPQALALLTFDRPVLVS